MFIQTPPFMERSTRNLAIISWGAAFIFYFLLSLMYHLRSLYQVMVPSCEFYGILGVGNRTVCDVK